GLVGFPFFFGVLLGGWGAWAKRLWGCFPTFSFSFYFKNSVFPSRFGESCPFSSLKINIIRYFLVLKGTF
ncbi:hypothetical protein, partial [Salmonella enterica]|uniref:hypothetical protein n=1 Tax=Salmonella enterica TaxID=28901 RepID=UPI0038BD901D